jgi:hypothetical protein
MGSGSGRSQMHENKKSSNCATLNLHRTCANSSNHHRWALGSTHRLGLAAAAVSCSVAYAAADSLPSPTPSIKIAVFEFELEDFSAAGQAKSGTAETSYLAQATDEAEQQLRASLRPPKLAWGAARRVRHGASWLRRW